ncbi:uncharacterized protein LOC126677936 [Mercurialis annua]|uniref:uncharacterized protein LOC126677936 n=1 Tax=Mercurialis annua TaxID=3986 RepID=UPI00215DE1B7|nr:uncharacterized protein LOC126677936 [Mercurialis annua]
MVATRSSPKPISKVPEILTKMKRKLVKKGELVADGGDSGLLQTEAVGNVKKKGKIGEKETGKKRRLNVDVGAADMKNKKGTITIEEPSRLVQNWDFVLAVEDRYSCRVAIPFRYKIIEDIKKTLSPRQLELFSETFLGNFLKLEPFVIQPQLFHSLFMREVKHPNNSEIWFKVSGYKLRFSIEEFALITGLNCSGDCNTLYSVSSNKLVATYFPNSSITREGLGVVFLNTCFKSDEDAVKLAIIYLFECFLCSSEINSQLVSRFLLDMVDSGDFNSFPWGILVYRNTVVDMKNRLVSKQPMMYYRLNGFPLALQMWFYEVCPVAANKICLLNDKEPCIPRMLKWHIPSKVTVTIKMLEETFYHMSREQLKLKNLVPTVDEKAILNIVGFFQTGKTKIVEDVKDSSDDEILGDFLKFKKERKIFSELKKSVDTLVLSESDTKKQLKSIFHALYVIGKHLGVEKQFDFVPNANEDVINEGKKLDDANQDGITEEKKVNDANEDGITEEKELDDVDEDNEI